MRKMFIASKYLRIEKTNEINDLLDSFEQRSNANGIEKRL